MIQMESKKIDFVFTHMSLMGNYSCEHVEVYHIQLCALADVEEVMHHGLRWRYWHARRTL